MQLPFSYRPPGGGGGGGGIPTITTDTTINVPTDQASINDALDWVRARVVLNGARVTINVESALLGTIAEQIEIIEEDLRFLTITNDGLVYVDTGAFVLGNAPQPTWLYLGKSILGALSGNWRGIDPLGTSPGVTSLSGDNSTINVINSVIDNDMPGIGFQAGLTVTESIVTVNNSTLLSITGFFNSTFTMASVVSKKIDVRENVNLYAFNHTISNDDVTAVYAKNSKLVFDSGNLGLVWAPGITVPVIDADGSDLTFNSTGFGMNSAAAITVPFIYVRKNSNLTLLDTGFGVGGAGKPGAGIIQFDNSNVVAIGAFCTDVWGPVAIGYGSFASRGCYWQTYTDGVLYQFTEGNFNINTDSIGNTVGYNPQLAAVTGGRASFSVTNVGIPSAGVRYTVAGGALVQSYLTAAWGGDNQAVLIPTALGLILA